MLYQLRSVVNAPLLKVTLVVVVIVIILQCILSFNNFLLHLPSADGKNTASSLAKDILESESNKLDKNGFIAFVEKLNMSRITVRGHKISYQINQKDHCSDDYRPNTIIKLNRKTCSFFKYSNTLGVNIYTELPRIISESVILPMIITLFVFLIIAFYSFYIIRMFTFSIKFSKYVSSFGMGNEVKESALKEDQFTKQIQKVIINAIERIGNAQKSRAKILANTLHDLRSPLHRIKLRMQMRNDELEAKDEQDFNEIELISSTLLLYGKDDWLFNETFKYIDLNELISQIFSDYLSLSHKITCNKVSKKKALIYAKENAIKRAITNIINNAFQHGSEVNLQVVKTKTFYSIHIIDNGPGIPDKNLNAVFDNYFSLKNTTGIGLTIAREVVEYHQGEIKLKNTGNGLDVEIRFPV